MLAVILCLVTGVSDGDTVTARCSGETLKIRIASIDCPEKTQPFGRKAKQATSALVFGKEVEIHPVTKDRYGRTVASLSVAGQDVGRALVRDGMCWRYPKYSKDPSLVNFEALARSEKVGLWADPTPLEPWKYRKTRK